MEVMEDSVIQEDSIIQEDSMSSADSVTFSMANENTTETVQSVDTPTTQRQRNPLFMADDTLHIPVEPKDVIEYEWPPKSGEKWFLQEQIGELLDIKSFSRKFPDLSRRKVEMEERDWLISAYNLPTIMSETHLRDLCAMRSIEIHDLMASEYPLIYQEFQKIASERLKKLMAEQAKEMEAIKNDSKRLAELREKALKSVSEFNKDLQLMKQAERKHFWDVQTSVIQSGANKWRKLAPSATKVGPYPVSLLLGQYQNYYKKFSPAELKKLPLGSVVDQAKLFPPHREPSPPPINVTEKEAQRMNSIIHKQQQIHNNVMETPRSEPQRKSARPSARRVLYAESADDEDDI